MSIETANMINKMTEQEMKKAIVKHYLGYMDSTKSFLEDGTLAFNEFDFKQIETMAKKLIPHVQKELTELYKNYIEKK